MVDAVTLTTTAAGSRHRFMNTSPTNVRAPATEQNLSPGLRVSAERLPTEVERFVVFRQWNLEATNRIHSNVLFNRVD